MKKYIRITDTVTKEIAVKHLESLWGKVYNNLENNIWKNILILNEDIITYYTSNCANILERYWYEEIILEETFKVWEQVACSDISKEKAIKDFNINK